MRRLLIALGAAAATLVLLAAAPPGASAAAAKPAAEAALEYGRDLISVVTGRQARTPTGNCLVWANAEGLGVGPAQLGGMHGVSMNINPKPLPGDGMPPTSFDAGLAELKASFPTTPAWIVETLQKNRAAIEAACGEDHETPFKVHAITAADRH
jgi:hypothetical protein